jgi:hypothetical protein
MTCNGWTNYQTWNVSLWFGELYEELALDYPNGLTGELLQTYTVEMLEESGQLPETGLAADVMNDFLRSVDWDDLASHYTVEEEVEEDA